MNKQYIELDWKNKDLGTKVNNTILEDFLEFKDKNEIKFCTLHQSKMSGNKVEVTWCVTTKYVVYDKERIKDDFKLFCDENKREKCRISKVGCQDNVYIVEYSIDREYITLG